jgi:hypothetical protein
LCNAPMHSQLKATMPSFTSDVDISSLVAF